MPCHTLPSVLTWPNIFVMFAISASRLITEYAGHGTGMPNIGALTGQKGPNSMKQIESVASNLIAMASNLLVWPPLLAMASNLIATASNPIASVGTKAQ